MLILALTLVFLGVCLLSFAVAFLSSVCAWIYIQEVSEHCRRSAPQRWAELSADPRVGLNPMRIAFAVLSEAANGDDRQVRLYAERVRSWLWRSAIAFAATIISGLILWLLGLAS